jgi:hypothetical protein
MITRDRTCGLECYKAFGNPRGQCGLRWLGRASVVVVESPLWYANSTAWTRSRRWSFWRMWVMGPGPSRGVGAGFLSGGADFNQDLARDFGVCGDGEGLVDVLDWQHVSDHLLDLRILVE